MRHRLIQHIALHLVTPLVLGLPVLIFLLWLSIGKGLDSLTLLTREISSRKPDNLQPLDEDSAPKEVRPMVLALNDLLARFTHSLESERRFTADAAHELRTPLAAIKMQLYAARVAVNEAERLRGDEGHLRIPHTTFERSTGIMEGEMGSFPSSSVLSAWSLRAFSGVLLLISAAYRRSSPADLR